MKNYDLIFIAIVPIISALCSKTVVETIERAEIEEKIELIGDQSLDSKKCLAL